MRPIKLKTTPSIQTPRHMNRGKMRMRLCHPCEASKTSFRRLGYSLLGTKTPSDSMTIPNSNGTRQSPFCRPMVSQM